MNRRDFLKTCVGGVAAAAVATVAVAAEKGDDPEAFNGLAVSAGFDAASSGTPIRVIRWSDPSMTWLSDDVEKALRDSLKTI